jgi:hypothetical protein
MAAVARAGAGRRVARRRLTDPTLETDDGELIDMMFTGVRADANHYLRTVPRFETAAPKYAFLNRLLAVGIGDIRPDGPVHMIEEIL